MLLPQKYIYNLAKSFTKQFDCHNFFHGQRERKEQRGKTEGDNPPTLRKERESVQKKGRVDAGAAFGAARRFPEASFNNRNRRAVRVGIVDWKNLGSAERVAGGLVRRLQQRHEKGNRENEERHTEHDNEQHDAQLRGSLDGDSRTKEDL